MALSQNLSIICALSGSLSVKVGGIDEGYEQPRRGFHHGQHKAYPQDRRVPLCNLYTTMLQRFGVETDRFNKASGTLGDFA